MAPGRVVDSLLSLLLSAGHEQLQMPAVVGRAVSHIHGGTEQRRHAPQTHLPGARLRHSHVRRARDDKAGDAADSSRAW